MKIQLIFQLAILMTAISLNGQGSLNSLFERLGDKTWEAEGTWTNGSPFKQQVHFKKYMNGKIVLAETMGFVDAELTQFGLRNLGIRTIGPEGKTGNFWEFDIFGGVTDGSIRATDDRLMYQYEYEGSRLTDMLEFLTDTSFTYKVGLHQNGKWENIFLETVFHLSNSTQNELQMPALDRLLTGDWMSKAWDGELHESWKKGDDGHMTQHATYIENGEVLYESTSKIEHVGNDVILFSVIKDNNPKIFKATEISRQHVLFENTEYDNPRWVTYRFGDDGTWTRTISGIEENRPVSYTFEFVSKSPD